MDADRPTLPNATRDLRILVAGSTLSTSGDTAAYVALVLRVQPSGSGYVAALTAAEFLPPLLLVMVTGLAVDRFEAKRLLIVCLLAQAAVAVALAGVSGASATVALVVLLGCFWAFTRPAFSALIPHVTGEDEAARGYSRIAMGQSAGWIVGPAVGGLLAGHVGVRATLLVDAASFAVLAGSLVLVRARRAVPPSSDDPGSGRPDRSGRAGIRLIWNDRYLRIALALMALALGIAVVDNVAAPYRFVDQLHAGASGFGTYLAVWAAGALVGSRLVGMRRLAGLSDRLLPIGNVVLGLGIAGIGAAPDYAFALVASLIGGVGNGVSNVAESIVIQLRTPERVRGRVFAATGALMQGAIGIGTVVGAPAVARLGASHTMLSFGLVAALSSGFGLVYAVRHRPDAVAAGGTDPPQLPSG